MVYRRPPDSFWHVVFFIGLLIVLFLLWGTQTAHGQSVSPSEPPSLTSLLTICEERLILLVSRLEERTLQVQSLRESLTASEAQLLEAEQSLQTLRTELEATLRSREALLKHYSELEASWTGYRNEVQDQLRAVQRERNLARGFAWVFGIGTAIGVVTSVILALK